MHFRKFLQKLSVCKNWVWHVFVLVVILTKIYLWILANYYALKKQDSQTKHEANTARFLRDMRSVWPQIFARIFDETKKKELQDLFVMFCLKFEDYNLTPRKPLELVKCITPTHQGQTIK